MGAREQRAPDARGLAGTARGAAGQHRHRDRARAPLWAFLAAPLRYLPFIGTWFTATIPIVLVMAVFDDWVRPLLVAGLFLTLDLTSTNVLEPWLFGARMGVGPIAILVSAIF